MVQFNVCIISIILWLCWLLITAHCTMTPRITHIAIIPTYTTTMISMSAIPPITPVDFSKIIYSSSTPHLTAGFLLLGTNIRIKYYHRLAKFPCRVGLPQTQWYSVASASINDLFHNGSTTVTWNTSYLNIVVQNKQVPTAQMTDVGIAANSADERFGLFINQDTGTVRICGNRGHTLK